MKKKIGILTYHRAVNYGAFLQCYSLVNAIKLKFPQCDVEVIDFETPQERINRLKGFIKSSSIRDFIAKASLYKSFKRSLKLLPLSKKRVVSNDEYAIYRNFNNDYDIIVVGSDAVWNDVVNKGKLNFFLNKVDGCSKYSYAASMNGLELESIQNKDVLSFLKESLKTFKYIGLREEKGEHVLDTVNEGFVYHHNCDPVCLLDVNIGLNDVVNRKLKQKGLLNKPIVCLMTKNEQVGKAVREAFSETHTIVSVYCKNIYSDVVFYDLAPLEFVVFLKHIDSLFSYFFHGCYTCLKNGVPAIAVDEDFDGIGEKTKIRDLYDRLGIPNWYFRPNDMQDAGFIQMITEAKNAMSVSQSNVLKTALTHESTFCNSFFESIEKDISNE